MSNETKVCGLCGGAMRAFELPGFKNEDVRTIWNCDACATRRREEDRQRFIAGTAPSVVTHFGPRHGKKRIEADNRVRAFADGSDRGTGSLFIQGICGSGKTQVLAEMGHIINEVGAIRQWESDHRPDRFSSCFKVHFGIPIRTQVEREWDVATERVLMIDDVDLLLAAEFDSELLRLVDYRYRHGLPTVFTSSEPMEAAFSQESVISRVAAMCGEPLELPAVNHRMIPR